MINIEIFAPSGLDIKDASLVDQEIEIREGELHIVSCSEVVRGGFIPFIRPSDAFVSHSITVRDRYSGTLLEELP